MIEHVAHIYVVHWIQGDAVRLVKPGFGGWTAITGESAHRRSPGISTNDAGFGIDAPHHVVVAFGDEDVALAVEVKLVRLSKLSGGGWTAIARIALYAGSRNDEHFPRFVIQTKHAV